MPTDISEKELETILVSYLRDHQGYEEGTSSDYGKEFGLDTERVKRFITSTQKEKVKNPCVCGKPSRDDKAESSNHCQPFPYGCIGQRENWRTGKGDGSDQ